jgi:acetyl esterase/lipase
MPLAPNNPAPDSFPKCLKLYRTLMAAAKDAGERVLLAGDSSGGNIVLCLVLEALREDVENTDIKQLNQTQVPLYPVSIMSVCPSIDLTRNNPDIDKVREYDPILTPEWIKQSARTWHADWAATDPRVSPINGNVSLFAKSGIKVHGVTASYDLLCPDGILFRDRCVKEGVRGEWLHWEKQMHCFILLSAYGLREGREGLEWIIDVLKQD